MHRLRAVIGVSDNDEGPTNAQRITTFLRRGCERRNFLARLISINPRIKPMLITAGTRSRPVSLLFVNRASAIFLSNRTDEQPFGVRKRQLCKPNICSVGNYDLLATCLLRGLPKGLGRDLGVYIVRGPSRRVDSFCSQRIVVRGTGVSGFTFIVRPDSTSNSVVGREGNVRGLGVRFGNQPSRTNSTPRRKHDTVGRLTR